MFLVEGARYDAMPQGSDNFASCEVVAGQTLLAAAGAPGGARVVLPFPNGAASLPLRWAVRAAKAAAESSLSALCLSGRVSASPICGGLSGWPYEGRAG